MYIVFSDDNDRLTPELWKLMEQAAVKAVDCEFGKALRESGIEPADADIELGVTIVSSEEIRDSVTDVLSFPQYPDSVELLGDILDDEVTTLAGDVVICYDKAVSQSSEYGTGITRELVYLFVHSIFHLFGYDHESSAERRAMRAREEEVLSAVGVSR